MSTRASIIITPENRGNRIYLYHHCDGYPLGVGTSLKKTLEKDFKYYWFESSIANHLVKGGAVSMYKKSKIVDGDFILEFDENGQYIPITDNTFEISNCVHGDVDYVYVINCKFKTLRCYRKHPGSDRDILYRNELVDIPNDFL